MCTPPVSVESGEVRLRVAAATALQRTRYGRLGFSWNSRVPPGLIDRFCGLDAECREILMHAAETIGISSRAFHSILRIARTIADLAESDNIAADHVREAIQHRRYGDGDFYWVKAHG
jgi:magnesium chelatase family protein